MQCAICEALHREHSQECEAEATATIRQRSQSLCRPQGETSSYDAFDPIVLSSRKRQVQIAFKLNQHRARDHRDLWNLDRDLAATA
jgi:hypothetical protein